MKRVFAYLFLFLYSYNLAGYLVVFSVRQSIVRSEIKKSLKESVPQTELALLAFHTQSLEQGRYPIQWIEDHEFRFDGRMYDIVRSHTTGDTTYYLCVNDVQEEALFANLDSHVQREMGNQGIKLDAFKDVFKNSLIEFNPIGSNLVVVAANGPPAQSLYESVKHDVASPPPRLQTSA